jgi:hypothetical protein
VVIGDFNLGGIPALPTKADSALIVDADAVLPRAVSPQGFQAVAWRNPQVVELGRCVEEVELRDRAMQKISRETRSLTTPKLLSFLVAEAFNHRWAMFCISEPSASGFRASAEFATHRSSHNGWLWSAVASAARHRFGSITRFRRPLTALPGNHPPAINFNATPATRVVTSGVSG